MIRPLARGILTVMVGASALALGWSVWGIVHNPLLRPLAAATAAQIRAATDREMAAHDTPARVIAALRRLLAEAPHNWVALDAVSQIAVARGIDLPPDLKTALDAARASDTSIAARARACAACAADASTCPLSPVLVCQAPMVLTPLGDIGGLATEGWNAAWGTPVDRVNLVLTAVGLASVALAVPSEGAGAVLGLGANALRLAHRMGRLPRPLLRLVLHAAQGGIDWARLRRFSASEAVSPSALRAVVHPAALRPLRSVVGDLGRIVHATGPREALDLVHYIDTPSDARRMANAAEALGPRTVGRAEVLGKTRFLRATLRFSRHAVALVLGMFGLLWGLGAALAHTLVHVTLRDVRRWARRRA